MYMYMYVVNAVMKRQKQSQSLEQHSSSGSTESAGIHSGRESWLDRPGDQWKLLAALMVFRTLNALFSVTAFVPDETWQSLEISHSMVFGYGYRTWEWQQGIRGFTHPLIYAILYKVLAVLHLDWPCLLVILPRVLQAPLAVASDYHVLKIGTHLFGKEAGRYALYCNVASWFTSYCVTRTLSNSIEACLTPIVLYHWIIACEVSDKVKVQSHTRLYLLMIGMSCLIRATGIILWTPIVLVHLWMALRSGHLQTVLKEIVTLGSLTLMWSLAVDCHFYGRFVLVQWEFLKFNVLEGHSALFGVKPWHWYLTEDCGVLLFTTIPLCVLGVWQSNSKWLMSPFWLAIWELLFHSALSHKEHRFVFPIVPIGSVYAGYGIVWLFQKYKQNIVHYLVCGLLLANIPMVIYFSLIHQRGTVAIMSYVRNDIGSDSSVLFLMPCHSTPFYSYIHQPINMTFLECPPPINENFVDVSEQFYSNPSQWLSIHYPTIDSAPSHIVLYEGLLKEIQEFLAIFNYQKVVDLFHSHFPEAEFQSSHILLLRR